MFCPLMTIARSVAADQVVSHGECQRERCAWWDDERLRCAIAALPRDAHTIHNALLELRDELRRMER